MHKRFIIYYLLNRFGKIKNVNFNFSLKWPQTLGIYCLHKYTMPYTMYYWQRSAYTRRNWFSGSEVHQKEVSDPPSNKKWKYLKYPQGSLFCPRSHGLAFIVSKSADHLSIFHHFHVLKQISSNCWYQLSKYLWLCF